MTTNMNKKPEGCPLCEKSASFNAHLVYYAICRITKSNCTASEEEIRTYINDNHLYELSDHGIHYLLFNVNNNDTTP